MLLLVIIGAGFAVIVVLLALVINPPEALVKKFYRIDKKPPRPGT